MKVSLIEYKNYINDKGHVVGHAAKSISEYANILGSDNVEIIASNEYIGEVGKYKLEKCLDYTLPFTCSVNYSNLFVKIVNIFKKYINIKKAIKYSKAEILWFVNIDWVFSLALITSKVKKKVIATVYCSKEQLGGKKGLVEIGLKKVDGFIITNTKLNYGDKIIHIPDYLYDSVYEAYNDANKVDGILIIGTIRPEKDIEKALEVLSKIDVNVRIVGTFYDYTLYERCQKYENDRISIENRKTENDEYYSLIGKYKYVLLPYKDTEYCEATSGVLLECMFLDAIPIAPKSLLDFNDIAGVSYMDLCDLNVFFLNECNSIVELNRSKRSNYFRCNIEKKVFEFLNDLLERDLGMDP